MNFQTQKRQIGFIAFTLIAVFLLASFPMDAEEGIQTATDASTESIERLFFFGESTTAHLCRRGGVLDTPSDAMRVLRDESGTRMLDRRILSSPVLLKSGNGETKKVSFSDAVKTLTPEHLVLSFGLNGIMGFIRNPQSFTDAYTILIQGIRNASPNTHIILQSVYPVRASMGYSVDVDTLNTHIRTLNTWIKELSVQEKTDFVDTASVLRDQNGALLPQYDAGDGIHLTNEAYRQILSYLSTHVSRSRGLHLKTERM